MPSWLRIPLSLSLSLSSHTTPLGTCLGLCIDCGKCHRLEVRKELAVAVHAVVAKLRKGKDAVPPKTTPSPQDIEDLVLPLRSVVQSNSESIAVTAMSRTAMDATNPYFVVTAGLSLAEIISGTRTEWRRAVGSSDDNAEFWSRLFAVHIATMCAHWYDRSYWRDRRVLRTLPS